MIRPSVFPVLNEIALLGFEIIRGKSHSSSHLHGEERILRRRDV